MSGSSPIRRKGPYMPPTAHADQSALDQFARENQQAEEHISTGSLAPAARILVEVVEKDPLNWRAFNNLGIIAWMQEAWEDAYSMFKKSVSLRPDYNDALVNLFDAALKLKRAPDALPLFEKAIDSVTDKEELSLIIQSIKEQGDTIYYTPRAQAVGIYNPLINEAHKLLEDGQLNKAMERYLQANDQEGPNAEIFSGLGIISYHQKRYDDAYTLFAESIKLCPYDPDAYLNLLDAAKDCNKLSEAREIFSTYVKEVPALQAIAHAFETA